MGIERKGIFQFKGNEVTVIGEDVKVGQQAPGFTATTQEWQPYKGLENTSGKVRIIGSLPSLNTSVCDREARRFNQEAANLCRCRFTRHNNAHHIIHFIRAEILACQYGFNCSLHVHNYFPEKYKT